MRSSLARAVEHRVVEKKPLVVRRLPSGTMRQVTALAASKDLTTQGFHLLGGRLDYIQQRRVGGLFIRLHIVNVFMWPASSTEDVLPQLTAEKGYNLLVWNKSGVTYWAVSDLEARELKRLPAVNCICRR
jgi:anti-sigma factor RsiW